jgi:hypothetical protein
MKCTVQEARCTGIYYSTLHVAATTCSHLQGATPLEDLYSMFYSLSIYVVRQLPFLPFPMGNLRSMLCVSLNVLEERVNYVSILPVRILFTKSL